MTIDDAIQAQKTAEQDFIELCRRGREDPMGVHVSEFGANLAAYCKAAEALWEAKFSNIAGTGVKIRSMTSK